MATNSMIPLIRHSQNDKTTKTYKGQKTDHWFLGTGGEKGRVDHKRVPREAVKMKKVLNLGGGNNSTTIHISQNSVH